MPWSPPASSVPHPRARIPVREPHQALLAGVVEADGLPHLPFGARLLYEAGGLAEAGKCEGEVLASEGVGVVLAHVWICVLSLLLPERVKRSAMFLSADEGKGRRNGACAQVLLARRPGGPATKSKSSR
ncbi:hypothetical protein LX32DRAFT_400152 [Colletotrichum zoysiae]|uniref:Uncharacterized protein n=1 Tax=Colletotrichum zoysiae TaxID=1216348 RepID=A0AAD9HI19_9PEZI|nr:hypothetical protein LX32DRAFT_400152 [Colletotrichum zoysiae]